MNALMNNTFFSRFNLTQGQTAKVLWFAVLAVALVFANYALAAGGGTALTDLNDWIEGELGGSVGMTIALVSFFSGMIAAIATRAFMPIIWGIGIGLVLGIFLQVVVGTMGVGLPLVAAAAAI